MGKVKDKILDDAAGKVRQIEEEFRRKEESMRDIYEEGLTAGKLENEKKLSLLYANEVKRLTGIRRLEYRKKLLAAKREILRELAESVKERIRNDPALYAGFIEAGVRRGVKTGNEEIVVSQQDRGLFTDEFMKRINGVASEKTGRECRLRLSDSPEETGGGIHLREGRENFNASISVSADSAADLFEPELAAMIFGEAD